MTKRGIDPIVAVGIMGLFPLILLGLFLPFMEFGGVIEPTIEPVVEPVFEPLVAALTAVRAVTGQIDTTTGTLGQTLRTFTLSGIANLTILAGVSAFSTVIERGIRIGTDVPAKDFSCFGTDTLAALTFLNRRTSIVAFAAVFVVVVGVDAEVVSTEGQTFVATNTFGADIVAIASVFTGTTVFVV